MLLALACPLAVLAAPLGARDVGAIGPTSTSVNTNQLPDESVGAFLLQTKRACAI